MGKYNVGEVWWIHFPFDDSDELKRRPAIVIDDDTIAILAMYVTSKNNSPYSIELKDWDTTGLSKPSWARIDKIVSVSEWHMDTKAGELSERDLLMILQLVAEYTNDTSHDFSLLAIKNKNEKYLQKFDRRWKCWLFPYIRSTDTNKENVDNFASDLLQLEISTEYVSQATHCKYSVSDDVYKIYNHKLYKVFLDVIPEHMQDDSFSIDGTEYKWMSMKEIENDEIIMEKNDEVVAFVKTKCS
jgi:mRNA-degrading endonuclease toxin of MazEF toxin-antitoxin module